MGRRFLLLTTLLTVVLTAFSQKGYVKRADRLTSEFLFPDATYLYKKEIKADTNDLLSKEKLVRNYLILGKLGDAEALCKKLVDNPLANPTNWFYYGQILRMQGRYADAGVAYQKFAELRPNDSRADEFKNFAINVLSINTDQKTHEVNDLLVNSRASEIGAFYYNSHLVFASNRDIGTGMKMVDEWTGKGFYDLYTADTTGNVKRTNKELKGLFNEGPVTVSADGKEMFFSQTNKHRHGDDGILKLGLYHADYDSVKKRWKNVKPFAWNSSTYDVTHPTLSRDGKQLFFVSDMPGGYGETDIYMCTRKDTGWNTPVNMGPVINTAGNDMFPYIADDGTLYFSSDTRVGLGGLDVYSASFNKGQWGDVENLGLGINSAADDFGYVNEPDGKHGYLVSNRDGGIGGDDIYRFTKLADIKYGIVADATTNVPIENAIITILSDKAEDRINRANEKGEFIFEVKQGRSYKVEVRKDGYVAYRKRLASLDMKDGKLIIGLEPIDQNLLALADSSSNPKYKKLIAAVADLGFKASVQYNKATSVSQRGEELVFELQNIYFGYKSTEITPESEDELYKVLKVMSAFPELLVQVGAHTDSRGDAQGNLYVGSSRVDLQACKLEYSIVSPK